MRSLIQNTCFSPVFKNCFVHSLFFFCQDSCLIQFWWCFCTLLNLILFTFYKPKTPKGPRCTEGIVFAFWLFQLHFSLRTVIVNNFVLSFGVLFMWKWISFKKIDAVYVDTIWFYYLSHNYHELHVFSLASHRLLFSVFTS